MFEIEFHKERLLVTPLIALETIGCGTPECEGCLAGGIGIELGWLFWTVRIGVPIWT